MTKTIGILLVSRWRAAVTDVLGYRLFGWLIMPTISWVLLVAGLAPLVALAAIGLTVMVSARVKGFREAQQISVVLILPILGLLFAQVSGLLVLGPIVMLELMLVFAAVDVVLFRLGLSLFQREEILSKSS